MGKGAIYGTSTRQKLNTKSSTEAELVGVAEVLAVTGHKTNVNKKDQVVKPIKK